MAFGEGPLSQPLLVEAIEDLFEPVLIHNNAEGYDKAILERFEEPAWNNPVVRYLDAAGKDLIPREAGVWTTAEVTARTVLALRAAKRTVPEWLVVLDEELNPKKGAKTPPKLPLEQLSQSALRFLPLTPLQARRVESVIAAGKDPSSLLSPRQRRLLTRVADALEGEPKALDGLKRPGTIDELAGYEARLERALKKLEAKGED